MNTYSYLDMEQLEKAAYDVHNVSALLGCLIKAVHDQENDDVSTKMNEVFCWQMRGALEMAFDILENASFIFFESNEILARKMEEEKERTVSEKKEGV